MTHGHDESPEDLHHQRDRPDGSRWRYVRREGTHRARLRRTRNGGAPLEIGDAEDERGSRRPFGPNRPHWFPDWRGETAVIVGAGPSAAQADIGQARGKARVLCINESWRLAPWADALYGCDGIWWRKSKGVPAFQGLKICQDGNACRDFPELMKVRVRHRVNEILTEKADEIGWGGNGGFQAMNLAAQFGPPRLMILVGFDMRLDRGVHWHGPHRAGLNNPREANMARWRAAVNGAAPKLAELGITVVNASLESALTAYQKMTLQDALAA